MQKRTIMLIAGVITAVTLLAPGVALAAGDKVQERRPDETGYFGEGQHAKGDPAVSERCFRFGQ
jgi:hypothetical protein